MMSNESPAARAGTAARQLLLFGRTISNKELMERLEAISVARLRDLAGRLFCESVPTLAVVGSASKVMDIDAISKVLGTVKAEAAQ